MKRVVIIGALIALSLSSLSCGGGAGSPTIPTGTNPGIASIVQLLPVRSVAQTNSFVFFKLKVLDGNGMPVAGMPVTFMNLSLVGVLSSTAGKTDGNGLATVTLYSTAAGFATVQAEVNTGAAVVRDQKTVFFDSRSTEEISPPTTAPAVLTLDVDDGDGVFDQPDDFTLFKTQSDNTRTILATLMQSSAPVAGASVTFGADRPFKTSPGAANCSDGSTICDVVFLNGNVKTTDNLGEASATMQVIPTSLSPISSVLNITASTTSPVSSNVISLFLKPVTISSVTVSANPQSVASGGTSKVSAGVTTSAGTPAPDGTTVNFTTLFGGIDPFGQTANGFATVTFTAPSVTSDTVTPITASVGGKSASTSVFILAPTAAPPAPAALSVSPGAASVNSGGTLSARQVAFVVSGGTPPYSITSSDPTKVCNDQVGPPAGTIGICDAGDGGVWNTQAFTATVSAGATSGSVTLNVFDSVGGSKSATITVIGGAAPPPPPGSLTIVPASISVTGIHNPNPAGNIADNVTFLITGGTGPYSMFSSNAAVVPNAAVTNVVGPPTSGSFTVDPDAVAVSATVTLTVLDAIGTTKTVTITVTPASSSMAVNPSTIAVTAGTNPVTFHIIGGLAPYNVFSSDTTVFTVGGGAVIPNLAATSFNGAAVAAGKATVTIVDSNGASATSAITVN